MVAVREIKPISMPRSSLSKKVKRAWNRIANAELRSFSLSKAIKTIRTSTNRILKFSSFRSFFPFGRRRFTKDHHYHYHNQTQFHDGKFSASAVYIDKLYTEPTAVRGESSGGKEEYEKVGVGEGKESLKDLYSVEDAWKAAVASSPRLRGIDERAEDFICKVREDMRLQKERSLLEFQEMLRRSA